MAIDCVTAGMLLSRVRYHGEFSSIHEVFDELLAYDFDTFVGGHLTSTGTRQDVEITKESHWMSTTRLGAFINKLNQAAVVSEAAKTIGTDNEFLLFRVILDKVTSDSVKELQPRWIIAWPVWMFGLESHVGLPLIYVRWDD